MNDETKGLQARLERATAPGDQVPADLDAETSSLRDSWLTLGRLLEDAQPAGDTPWQHGKVAPRPAAHRRRPLAWAVAVAVAASLLIAAGLTLAYRSIDGSGGMRMDLPTIAQDDRAPTDVVADAADAPDALARADSEPQRDLLIAAVPDELQWDSALDDQITAVAQATAWVREDWYAQAVSFSAIERGLDEIKKDIEDGTL